MVDLIIAFVIACITYGMGKLSKKLGWNKEFAIPVQNFLIAVFSFGLIALYDWIIGQPIDSNSIFNYILVAIAGVGGATLSYDNIQSLKKEE